MTDQPPADANADTKDRFNQQTMSLKANDVEVNILPVHVDE